ncbi:MAG: AAA family ATPase [Clostridiales Family XIII bacterium]|jgi:predicted AAA+ superfamily ATPase|nr:AAA family ATPase [Clostridiales Family XIII bacterium]
MERIAIEKLIEWKNGKDRQPLILKGSRQVGKTWLLKEFGRNAFKDVYYANFEQTDMSGVFDGELSPPRIIEYLSALHGRKIIPHETLLIFDEIQELPRALTSLKYFAEEAPEYAICCAGSHLGIALHEGTSFPVGKVDVMELFPMSFEEFLLAEGLGALVNLVKAQPESVNAPAVAEKLSDRLRHYFVIGGMPKAVSKWIETRDHSAVQKIQNSILDNYADDFSKHVPRSIQTKVSYIWESLPTQLARENRKFLYGLVRTGARAREYESALLWLRDMGFVRPTYRIDKPKIPLKAYADLKSFKLFALDIGLLSKLSGLSPGVVASGNTMFSEFKGSLTEQYVFGELMKSDVVQDIHYWTSNGTAEVDFVISSNGEVIPVEVKSEKNLKAKSLQVYRKSFAPKISVRASMAGFRVDDGLVNIPLYALFNFGNCLRQASQAR